MKVLKTMWPFKRALSLLTGICLLGGISTAAKAQSGQKTPGFALLELYTSEGCSSCPPAEALLEKIHAGSKGQPVYVLAFHVDYWDRLGWKDAFSQHDFSLRQYDYSRKLSAQVYTPQLVVNGRTEGVGSDEGFVRDAIRSSLSRPAKAVLHASMELTGTATATISYDLQGQAANAKLVIALLQHHAVSRVSRGENKGRTLTHEGIVRTLNTYSLPAAGKGTVRLSLPAGFTKDGYEVVGFLQQTGSGQIIAAAPVVING